MSCITEILKLKGDKEFLLEPGHVAVEGGGTYKDHEYLIVLNSMGHRCGYVALKPEHKYSQSGCDYDSLDIQCHGGLTFMASDHHLKVLLPIPCNDIWIGFDCGHYNDLSDEEAFRKYYGEELYKKKEYFFNSKVDYGNTTVKDFDYAEDECHSIIDQLIVA